MAMAHIQAAAGSLMNAEADIKRQIDDARARNEHERQSLQSEIDGYEKERIALAVVITSDKEGDDKAPGEIARNRLFDIEGRKHAAEARLQELEKTLASETQNLQDLLSAVQTKRGDVERLSSWQGVS